MVYESELLWSSLYILDVFFLSQVALGNDCESRSLGCNLQRELSNTNTVHMHNLF